MSQGTYSAVMRAIEDNPPIKAQALQPPVRTPIVDVVMSFALNKDIFQKRSAEECAHRLWSTHRILNREIKEKRLSGGAAAVTVVLDGNDIITASAGNAAAFALIFNEAHKIVKVIQLNRYIHKPTPGSSEAIRIQKQGGVLHKIQGIWRVQSEIHGSSGLNVSRSLGGFHYKGMCADPSISITSSAMLLGMAALQEGHVYILTCTDRLTNAVFSNDENYNFHNVETFIYQHISAYKAQFWKQEDGLLSLAFSFCRHGEEYAEQDNTAVIIQEVKDTRLMGCYEGYGGSEVANYVATHLPERFMQTAALSAEEYSQHDDSLDHLAIERLRDIMDSEEFMKEVAEEDAFLTPPPDDDADLLSASAGSTRVRSGRV